MKFESLPSLTTAILISPPEEILSSSETLSSSSMPSFSINGTIPRTGLEVFRSKKSTTGKSKFTSPRNLLMTRPLTKSRSSSSKSSKVPTNDAKAPPRSISATKITGALRYFATRMLTISLALRLTSAGEPAPSIMSVSNSAESFLRAALTASKALSE